MCRIFFGSSITIDWIRLMVSNASVTIVWIISRLSGFFLKKKLRKLEFSEKTAAVRRWKFLTLGDVTSEIWRKAVRDIVIHKRVSETTQLPDPKPWNRKRCEFLLVQIGIKICTWSDWDWLRSLHVFRRSSTFVLILGLLNYKLILCLEKRVRWRIWRLTSLFRKLKIMVLH